MENFLNRKLQLLNALLEAALLHTEALWILFGIVLAVVTLMYVTMKWLTIKHRTSSNRTYGTVMLILGIAGVPLYNQLNGMGLLGESVQMLLYLLAINYGISTLVNLSLPYFVRDPDSMPSSEAWLLADHKRCRRRFVVSRRVSLVSTLLVSYLPQIQEALRDVHLVEANVKLLGIIFVLTLAGSILTQLYTVVSCLSGYDYAPVGVRDKSAADKLWFERMRGK